MAAEKNKTAFVPYAERRPVFLSIGSNTPDADARVARAAAILREAYPGVKISHTYRTRSWGGNGPDYLNCVVYMETATPPDELKITLKTIERELGRIDTDKTAGLIPVDIDLVVYNGDVLRPRDFNRDYFRNGYCSLIDPREIRIDNYNYTLSDDSIAKHPLADRDSCKLLVCDRNEILASTTFSNIGHYLPKGSLLIYNDTRVINARLRFAKQTGASIEIFCLEPYDPVDYQVNFSSCLPVYWRCMVGNSKKWSTGVLQLPVTVGDRTVTLYAERTGRDGKDSIIRFSHDDPSVSFSEIIAAAGSIPIPPYLNRESELSDTDDYQTVYSHVEGSVAAPTAGLHFTDRLLDNLRASGIDTRGVTLHVGAGTFQPVKAKTMGDHDMHSELIDVSRSLIAELADTTRPVTAVGTTSVRTLESLYHIGCSIKSGHWNGTLDQWYPYRVDHPGCSRSEALHALVDYLDERGEKRLIARTHIIIAPGYTFRIVDSLITNFHQPGSTLLLLIAAIVGDNWRSVYKTALTESYRFLSYGDACLFLGLPKI